MFWWTSLLYTVPVTEKELMTQCDIVLVYIRDGVFGELEKIRAPAPKSQTDTDPPHRMVTPSKTRMQKTQDLDAEPNTTEPTTSNLAHDDGITQSTTDVRATVDDSLVTTENATAPHVAEHKEPTVRPTAADIELNTDVIIPKSIDGAQPGNASNQQLNQSS